MTSKNKLSYEFEILKLGLYDEIKNWINLLIDLTLSFSGNDKVSFLFSPEGSH